jgi:heat shock protein HtpX
MSISDVIVRITHLMSTTGQLLLLFALPAVFAGVAGISFLALVLLVFAPTICLFMQTALSRAREYEADRVGAELAGDVYGLISALQKLEKYHLSLIKRMFRMKWIYTGPSLLLTHPPTKDRIKRLLQISEGGSRDWPDWLHRSHAW